MPLTWRNVDAPDFRPSMEGYQTFSNLLGEATRGLSRGLDKYDATIDADQNNKFAINLLKYQDPAAYKAALTSGSLFDGVDQSRLSDANLASASGRVNSLLNQATLEGNLAETGYLRTRQHGQDAASDLLATLLPQRDAAYAANKGAEFDAAHPLPAGLSYDQTQKYMGSGLQYQRDVLGVEGDKLSNTGRSITNAGGLISNAGNAFRNQTDKVNFAHSETSYNEGRQAQAIIADVVNHGLTPEERESYFNNHYADTNGTVSSLVRQGLFGSAGGTGISASTSNSTVGGVSGGGNMNFADTVVGGGKVPLSTMSMGDAVSYGKNVLIPQTRNNAQLGLAGTGKGSSAMGAYQILSTNLPHYAEAALGTGWQNKPFNIQNQDKIAEYMFNESKGGDLSKIWSSLPAKGPGAYKNVPWSQMREIIAAGESSANLPALRAQLGAGTVGLQGANMGATATNRDAFNFEKNSTDTRDVATVADDLLKGTLKGGDRGEVIGQLTDIMSRSKGKTGNQMNAAQAASVLASSIKKADGPSKYAGIVNFGKKIGLLDQDSDFGTDGSPNLGAGVGIDSGKVNAAIKQFTSGDTQRAVVSNHNNANAQTSITGAQAALQAAQTAYAAKLNALRANPRLDISKEAADLRSAQIAAAAAGASAAPIMNFGDPQPVAPAPVVVTRPATPPPARTMVSPSRQNDPLSAQNIQARRADMWAQAFGGR